MVAAAVLAGNLDATAVQPCANLVLRGQHRVHMKKESPSRKRAIAAAICETAVTATIYDAGHRHRSELDTRTACLRAVVADAAGAGAAALVLDRMTRCGGRTTSG